jgi:hypothetical protein
MKLGSDFEQLREIMIAQGEIDHEAAIAEFPIRVNLGGWVDDLDTNCERMQRIELWLKSKFGPDRYLAFPGTSMGKYKEDCFVVFMRTPEDAILFKLSTL